MLEQAAAVLTRSRLALRFAGAHVRSNPRRVLLAVLGVAIGIAAVTSMLLIGHSVTAQAERALNRLGADLVLVSLGSVVGNAEDSRTDPAAFAAARSSDPLRLAAQLEQAARLLRTMPEVADVTPVARLNACTAATPGPLANADLIAVKPELAQVLSLSLRHGRFLHPLDQGQPWVVLGAGVWSELTLQQPGLRVGGLLDLCGKTFQIAGVLQPYFGDDLLPMFKFNRAMLVSPAAAEPLGGVGLSTQLLVRARTDGVQGDLAPRLAARLTEALGQPAQTSGARQLNQLRQEQASLFTRFLAVLGVVALIVGSLGIANVMLVSVSERKAEIGLRMALGARASDIVLQFLIESVLICLCGAVLGLLVGMLGSMLALAVAQIPFFLDAATPLWASVLSLVAGLAAGAYPAWQAARLDPVSTLQGGG